MKKQLFLFLLCFFLFACGEDAPVPDQGKFTFQIETTVNGEPFELNTTYHFDDGRPSWKFEGFLFYLSFIQLIREDGSLHSLTDALLHDASNNSPYEFQVPDGNYTGLVLGIGLNEELNAGDPNSYEVDHPLSIFRNTYWSWASKYKFIMIEGRSSEGGLSSELSNSFAYHTGFDTLYTEISFDHLFKIADGSFHEATFSLDVSDIFYASSEIDVLSERLPHAISNDTELELAFRLTNNFKAALMLRPSL